MYRFDINLHISVLPNQAHIWFYLNILYCCCRCECDGISIITSRSNVLAHFSPKLTPNTPISIEILTTNIANPLGH